MENPQDSAQKKPVCKCGSAMFRDAAKAKYICQFCGFSQDFSPEEQTSPAQKEKTTEPDFESMLQSSGFEKGWGADLKSFTCLSCNAAWETHPDTERLSSCCFCGDMQIADAPPDEALRTPDSMLPFTVDKNAAFDIFQKWLRGKYAGKNKPESSREKKQAGGFTGTYLPFWSFSASLSVSWTAISGFNKGGLISGLFGAAKESSGMPDVINYTALGLLGGRLHWTQENGKDDKNFTDELIPASRGLFVISNLLHSTGPFERKKYIPYQPHVLKEWIAERYGMKPKEAWAFMKNKLEKRIEKECENKISGNTYRDLHVWITWHELQCQLVLLPLWIGLYHMSGKTYRFLVNGESGKFSVETPLW